ncbi:unnamed protein product [Closterium sp. NIES-54]
MPLATACLVQAPMELVTAGPPILSAAADLISATSLIQSLADLMSARLSIQSPSWLLPAGQPLQSPLPVSPLEQLQSFNADQPQLTDLLLLQLAAELQASSLVMLPAAASPAAAAPSPAAAAVAAPASPFTSAAVAVAAAPPPPPPPAQKAAAAAVPTAAAASAAIAAAVPAAVPAAAGAADKTKALPAHSHAKIHVPSLVVAAPGAMKTATQLPVESHLRARTELLSSQKILQQGKGTSFDDRNSTEGGQIAMVGGPIGRCDDQTGMGDGQIGDGPCPTVQLAKGNAVGCCEEARGDGFPQQH